MPSWIERVVSPPPNEKQIYQERKLIPNAICPECGGDDIRRYPIACHLGPRMVIKCQQCMHVVKLERPAPEDKWPPYRAVAYDWEASPAERASRELNMIRQENSK